MLKNLFVVVLLSKWSVVLLCLVLSLCAGTSLVSAQETTSEECISYFEEIIEIQRLREMLRIGTEILIERHERGKVSKKELDSTLAVWHTTESRLRAKVTKIYDAATGAKCFEDVTEKEEK